MELKEEEKVINLRQPGFMSSIILTLSSSWTETKKMAIHSVCGVLAPCCRDRNDDDNDDMLTVIQMVS